MAKFNKGDGNQQFHNWVLGQIDDDITIRWPNDEKPQPAPLLTVLLHRICGGYEDHFNKVLAYMEAAYEAGIEEGRKAFQEENKT